MKNTKFTKGKWIIEYSNRDDSYDIYNESKDEFVCTTMNSLDIEKYNALLISKAPEMLEMLERCLNMCDKRQFPTEQELKSMATDIQQLIKEATEL